VPSERVMAIIRDGGIPIVSYNRQGLRVGKIAFGTKYVALSHVWWSGGLRNLRRERLTSVSTIKSLSASKEHPHIDRSGKTESWPSRLLARGR
jgi:hypothetical protein